MNMNSIGNSHVQQMSPLILYYLNHLLFTFFGFASYCNEFELLQLRLNKNAFHMSSFNFIRVHYDDNKMVDQVTLSRVFIHKLFYHFGGCAMCMHINFNRMSNLIK